MLTNMTNFDTDIVQTLEELKYNMRINADLGLMISKTTDYVEQHYISTSGCNLNLKGMIITMPDKVNMTQLVAPGCVVPLEQPSTDLQVRGYSMGHDGIMYRFYNHNDVWCVSTSGCINPNTYWGPRGTPTFLDLIKEAMDKDLVNCDKLTPGYCYYAILETPNFTNLIKHENLKLTLIDIVDCSSVDLHRIPLESDNGFKIHMKLLTEKPQEQEVPEIQGPLTSKDAGYNIHYTDESIYRVESKAFSEASESRFNLSDPSKQWVNLFKRGKTYLDKFLQFFPWHNQLFDKLNTKFNALVESLVSDCKKISSNGSSSNFIPARHISYMRDLNDELTDFSYLSIREHLLSQDAKRIYFLVNPYNVSPLMHY